MSEKFYLQYFIFKRMMKLLTRKSKSLKLVYFNHIALPGNTDKIAVKYKFSNAVCYAIDGKKITSNKLVIKRPVDETNIRLTVYGFFRQTDYIITVTHDDVSIIKQLPVRGASMQSKTDRIYYVEKKEGNDSDTLDNSPKYSVA